MSLPVGYAASGPAVPDRRPRKKVARKAVQKSPVRRSARLDRPVARQYAYERASVEEARARRGIAPSYRKPAMPAEEKRARAKRKAAETRALKQAGAYVPRKKGRPTPYKTLGKQSVVAIERTATRRVESVLSREKELNKRWSSLVQAWTRFSLAMARGDQAGADKWMAIYSQRGTAYNELLEERAAVLKTGRVPQRQRAPRLIHPPSGKRPADGTKAQMEWDKRYNAYMEAYQHASSAFGSQAYSEAAAATPSVLSSAYEAPPPAAYVAPPDAFVSTPAAPTTYVSSHPSRMSAFFTAGPTSPAAGSAPPTPAAAASEFETEVLPTREYALRRIAQLQEQNKRWARSTIEHTANDAEIARLRAGIRQSRGMAPREAANLPTPSGKHQRL